MGTVQMLLTAHCSLKTASLKMAQPMGMVGRVSIPRVGRREGALDGLGPAPGSRSSHIHSMTSFNNTSFEFVSIISSKTFTI